MISKSPAMKQEKGNSAAQKTAVGSGSRPSSSKMKIDTSAPKDAHGLGRKPSGALR